MAPRFTKKDSSNEVFGIRSSEDLTTTTATSIPSDTASGEDQWPRDTDAVAVADVDEGEDLSAVAPSSDPNPVVERALSEPIVAASTKHRDLAGNQIEVMRYHADLRRLEIEGKIRELEEERLDVMKVIRMYDYALAARDEKI